MSSSDPKIGTFKAHQQTFSKIDLKNHENHSRFSSFGKMTLSLKKTQPIFSFGTQIRKTQNLKNTTPKNYSQKISRKEFFMPVQKQFKKAPQFKFGHIPIYEPINKPPYEHYTIKNLESQEYQESLLVKKKSPTIIFPQSKRVVQKVQRKYLQRESNSWIFLQ